VRQPRTASAASGCERNVVALYVVCVSSPSRSTGRAARQRIQFLRRRICRDSLCCACGRLARQMHSPSIYAACAELTHTPHRELRSGDPDDNACELRRHELRGWAEAAGFQNIDVRNLGQPDAWEMRFDRGTNAECTTAAEAKRWLGFVARGCGCRFESGQFVAIVDGERTAARFRLQPRPLPEAQ
jgi:hypothetical protein